MAASQTLPLRLRVCPHICCLCFSVLVRCVPGCIADVSQAASPSSDLRLGVLKFVCWLEWLGQPLARLVDEMGCPLGLPTSQHPTSGAKVFESDGHFSTKIYGAFCWLEWLGQLLVRLVDEMGCPLVLSNPQHPTSGQSLKKVMAIFDQKFLGIWPLIFRRVLETCCSPKPSPMTLKKLWPFFTEI